MSNTILRDIGNGLAGLFGGGKVDPERQMHLEVLFGLLGYVAKLDSLITSHEAEFINDLMDQLKLSMREREVALGGLERGKSRQLDIAAEFARFSAVHHPGSRESDSLYTALIQIAAADERLRLQERQFLELATEKLGYRTEELDRRLATCKFR